MLCLRAPKSKKQGAQWQQALAALLLLLLLKKPRLLARVAQRLQAWRNRKKRSCRPRYDSRTAAAPAPHWRRTPRLRQPMPEPQDGRSAWLGGNTLQGLKCFCALAHAQHALKAIKLVARWARHCVAPAPGPCVRTLAHRSRRTLKSSTAQGENAP